MNVKLLRRIQKHILAEPKRYDQNLEISTVGELSDPDTYASCGTKACIGGWAVILSNATSTKPESVSRYAKRAEFSINILGRAKTLLGLNDDQSSRLFDCVFEDSEWPQKFASRYENARTPLARAKVAVARIDHFIKTKGAE